MKNNRTSWSFSGATNMAKLLTEIENNTLNNTVRKCFDKIESAIFPMVYGVPKNLLAAKNIPFYLTDTKSG